MAKECPNCKAIGKRSTLRYKTKSVKDSSGQGTIGRAFYVSDRCGLEIRV